MKSMKRLLASIIAIILAPAVLLGAAGCAETIGIGPSLNDIMGWAYETESEMPSASPDPAAAVYSELYEILSGAVDELGYGHIIGEGTSESVYHGVYYADLIDFDNDGVFELLYLYGDGAYTFTFEIYGRSGNKDTYVTFPADYIDSKSIGTSRSGESYYIYRYWQPPEESGAIFHTITDGEWAQALRVDVLSEYNPDNDTWSDTWYVNGNQVDEDAYIGAEKSLDLTEETPFDFFSFFEGRADTIQIDATLSKLAELRGDNQ